MLSWPLVPLREGRLRRRFALLWAPSSRSEGVVGGRPALREVLTARGSCGIRYRTSCFLFILLFLHASFLRLFCSGLLLPYSASCSERNPRKGKTTQPGPGFGQLTLEAATATAVLSCPSTTPSACSMASSLDPTALLALLLPSKPVLFLQSVASLSSGGDR